MINRYCPKHKERLRKEAWERYQNLSEETKSKERSGTDMKIFLKNKSRNYIVYEKILFNA